MVITGASSGIGRAAALRFADKGARVVALARREAALQELAGEIESRGGRALAVPADVADVAAVESVARRAVEEFDAIDVWVNNAGVTLFAPFDEAPLDVYRRVLETNYMGTVNGARAAIAHMRRRGGGVIINNASVFGEIGAPYLSAYISSKWAIRGLGESLRMELRGTGIRVCTLMPGSIDTPIFQHAANYTSRAIKPINPIVSVDRVARAIVKLARRPRRELIVGRVARVQALQHHMTPGLAELMTGFQVKRDHFASGPAEPTEGGVTEPMPEHTSASGGWRRRRRRAQRVVAAGASGALVVGASLAARGAGATRRSRR